MNGGARQVWVFHRGALGDSVLLWPMLRAMVGEGCHVTLVSDASKAQLAARELGITPENAEQRRFTDLWVAGAMLQPVGAVDEVLAFIGGGEAQESWIGNLRTMFPGAVVRLFGTRPDSVLAREWSAPPHGMPQARVNHGGPIVCHIGAGSDAKRWPLERFCDLSDRLARCGEVRLIAGEVESERLNTCERQLFAGAGGEFIQDFEALASLLRSASVMVGCDSGPTHLAAQLGIRTMAIFGPTDPARWGPVGPLARWLAPPATAPIEWLEVEEAWAAVAALLDGG
jgi:heptosyltransferase III